MFDNQNVLVKNLFTIIIGGRMNKLIRLALAFCVSILFFNASSENIIDNLIGISLKKGSGILGYKNYHEPDKINLKKVDLKMSALGSLAGTLSFVGDGVDDMSLAFRIFSAKDTDLIRGEGEKKGAEAVQGKVALELLDTFTGKSWKRSITAAGGADILELEKGKWIFTTNGKKKFKTAKANWAFISKRRNLTFARGASKVNHSNAFRSEKTFLTWLNKIYRFYPSNKVK